MNRLLVTSSPHIKDPITTSRMMLDVIIALVPALAVAVYVFGWRALLVVLVCVASCVVLEWAYEKAVKRESTVGDLSAVITGILLAYNLPVTTPIWQAVVGSFVAIILVKQLFGGLGKNFANPAVTARIVMFLAFSGAMTNFAASQGALGALTDATTQATTQATSHATVDALSSATPLALIVGGHIDRLPPVWDLLRGLRGGALGETGALALILGGVYLLIRRVISWQTPVCFIGTVFVLTALLGQQPVYQVLSGGLLLGAIFMATDYVTTPQTGWGRVIFGVGAGLITVLIRVYGSYPEGVSFAILLMNILTPYISRATMHKPLGGRKA